MVSALGINIQRDVRDRILRRLGARRPRRGRSAARSEASRRVVDSNWLLNSLVVVIIGGMGSLAGAAIGSLLLGLTTNLSAAYLPADLQLLLDRPDVRPARDRARRPSARHLRATGVTRFATIRARRRPRGAGRRRARPAVRHDLLGERAADAGAPARHHRRQPDVPVGVRRHGLARAGRGLRHRRVRPWQRDDERQHEGAQPGLGPVDRRRCSVSCSARGSRSSSACSHAGASASTSS